MTIIEKVIILILVIIIGLMLKNIIINLYFKFNIKAWCLISGSGDRSDQNNSKLLIEYNNWIKARSLVNAITKNLDKKKIYEAYNILERFAITQKNFEPQKVGLANPFISKLKEELIEKNITSIDRVDDFTKKLFDVKINPVHSVPKFDIVDNGLITIGNFIKKISKSRLGILRDIATDYDIVRAALRYSSIMSAGQQWNIPCNVFKVLVNTYNITFEGFASPFNSQIIRFKNSKTSGVRFGSLFKDTDEIFGSVGNFFDHNLVGLSASINPPYIISIMEKSVEKSIKTIKDAEAKNEQTFLFITVPNWTDAEYYEKLVNLTTKWNTPGKKMAQHIKLDKFKHYYENSNDNDRKVIANFNSSIFILSYGHNYTNFTSIINAFKP